MTLDGRPDESVREAMRRQHDDDRAARHRELLQRDEAESVDALEAFWDGAMRGSARHYAASQTWDGHDGRPVRLHAEAVGDGLVREDAPEERLG